MHVVGVCGGHVIPIYEYMCLLTHAQRQRESHVGSLRKNILHWKIIVPITSCRFAKTKGKVHGFWILAEKERRFQSTFLITEIFTKIFYRWLNVFGLDTVAVACRLIYFWMKGSCWLPKLCNLGPICISCVGKYFSRSANCMHHILSSSVILLGHFCRCMSSVEACRSCQCGNKFVILRMRICFLSYSTGSDLFMAKWEWTCNYKLFIIGHHKYYETHIIL